jgi:peptidoglycan/LPS O-acetylase OafA/YrhL
MADAAGPKPSRLSGLDDLRGLFALIVCASHALVLFTSSPKSVSAADAVAGISARLAVLGFFCLSGFVISRSTLLQTRRDGRFDWTAYLLARFFRIVPPLLFVIAFTLVASLALHAMRMDVLPAAAGNAHPVYTVRVGEQLKCLVTLCARGELTGHFIGPLWSLTYEIQLYAIAGLLLCALDPRRTAPWRIALALAAVLFSAAAYRRDDAGWFTLQIVCFLAFGAGWLSCRVGMRVPDRRRLIIGVLGFAVFLAGFVYLHAERLTDNLATPGLLWSQVTFAVAVASVLPLVARLPSLSALQKSAAFSYTLYILHAPLLDSAYFIVMNSAPHYSQATGVALAIGGFLASIAVSAFVASAVERPQAQRALFERLIGYRTWSANAG